MDSDEPPGQTVFQVEATSILGEHEVKMQRLCTLLLNMLFSQ